MVNPKTDTLTEPTESERTLAVALIALAGTILVAIITLAVLILPNIVADGTTLVYLIAAAILFFLITSILYGGRGVAYGPGRKDFRDRFNLQAITGLIAVLLIFPFGYTIKIAEAPSDYDTLSEKVDILSQKMGGLESKVPEIFQQNETAAEELRNLASEVASIKEEIDVLKKSSAE